jgi:hypothetical protein
MRKIMMQGSDNTRDSCTDNIYNYNNNNTNNNNNYGDCYYNIGNYYSGDNKGFIIEQ